MICFVTYCSKDKSHVPGDIPAIERYLDKRIQIVQKNSLSLEADFFILSGRFGLLEADHRIPWYDHLMKNEEVERMTIKVTPLLSQYSEIVFWIDPHDFIEPYQQTIEAAAANSKIPFRLEQI
ncbi:MAG: hypothetical protein JKX97_06975 [Candidatus Lindowbacteria bacterium]|nr:hypothetical protein [Candidatus Lindowbacteria bacterium]